MTATLRARTYSALVLTLTAVLMAGLVATAAPAEAKTKAKRQHHALQVVKNQKGDRYQYGASGPNRFDCSGLVYYSFRKAGFTRVPRTSDQQARFSRRIPRKNMRKGDLMFFHNGGDVYHVGVFTGWRNGRRVMVHAPYGDKRVHRTKLWTNSWFPGTLR